MKRIILFMFLTCPLFGQSRINITNEYWFRYTASPRLDGHSLVHAGGTAGIYAALRLAGIRAEYAFWTAAAINLWYEVHVDGFQNKFIFGPPDPTGFDVADVLCGFAGAGLAYIGESMYRVKLQVHADRRGKMLAVNIKL